MALVKRRKEHNALEIAIWKIEESEDFLHQMTGITSSNKSANKRLEHLAGRYLLQQLLPNIDLKQIKTTSSGKPYLEQTNCHFSLSHSYPYVAAAISYDQAVGIDIQNKVTKIERLYPKFLSEKEISITGTSLDALTFCWCAKEAMFKKYSLGGVDFKDDMPIINFSKQEISTSCIIDFKKYTHSHIEYINGECLDNYCWAVTS